MINNCDNKRNGRGIVFIGWLLLTILVDSVSGQGGTCSSTSITSDEFQYGITSEMSIDTGSLETLIIEYPMQNTLSISSRRNVNMEKVYIDATIDQSTNVLSIFTTAEFANYEEEQTVDEITLSVELVCTTGSRRLLFRQRLTELNNHSPVFGEPVYDIKVQLPLPMGFDLTYFQEISARDIDLKNNRVTFSSPDSGVIDVGTSDHIGADGKTFYATLKANQQLLSVNGRLEFIIIGTDSGTPPRSGNATVIITGDELVTFVPIPRFEKPLYQGTFDSATRVLQLENVVIAFDTFSNDISLDLTGGDSALFSFTMNQNEVTITLVLPPETDVNGKTFLMTTLIASRANVDSGSTVLHVDIAVEPTLPTPVFTQLRYRAQLDESRQVTVDMIALVPNTYSEDVVFFLEEDDATLFQFTRQGNQVNVTLTSPLTEEQLLGKTLLLTTIGAYRETNLDDRGYSAILIDVPTTTPVPSIILPTFERSVYRGSLDADNRLTIEPLVLLLDTYSADIVFSLQEADDFALFVLISTTNTVTISLATDLLEEQVADKSVLIITVVARRSNGETGLTTILVEVAISDPVILPAFEKPDYTGIIDVNLALTIEPIVLNASTYTSDVIFVLQGGDRSLFAITNNQNSVIVALARPLTEDDLQGRTFFMTVLVASLADVGSSYTFLRFDTPIITPEPAPTVPAFTKPSFKGSLDESQLLAFEPVFINASTYSEDIVFELTEGDHALFQTTNIQNELTVTLSNPLSASNVDGRSYLMTILNAHKPNVGSDATVLLVNIPVTTPRPAIPVPTFERPLFHGSLDNDYRLTVEDVILMSATYSAAVSFTFDGEDSVYFVLTNAANIVTIALKSSITAVQLNDKEFLTFNVIAMHPETNNGNTSILISLPEKICPVITLPVFENKLYSFWLKPDYVGVIGNVLAAVEAVPESLVTYRLELNNNAVLSSRLSIDGMTGALSLSSALAAGTYTFRVVATVVTTTEQGETSVHITVEDVIECPERTGLIVEKALAIKYLIENVEHTEILPSKIGDCTFYVDKIVPNDLEYVKINSVTNQLTSISFDRESDTFSTYEVPQIQVTLHLNCSDDYIEQLSTTAGAIRSSDVGLSRSIEPGTDDGRWYVLTADVSHSDRTTTLTIIIEDENDNSPIFVTPLAPIIGYPDATIAEQIMPTHVAVALAVDRDAGLNAKVRYSLATPSENFRIDTESGVLTPRRDAFKTTDQETLQLVATDRNGASDGRVTHSTLTVKKLEARHITVITIEEDELEAVNYVVDNINAELGLQLAIVHSAVISLGEASTIERQAMRNARATNDVNALRIFVYAIDTANEFMDTADVQRKLQEINSATYAMSSVAYENVFKEAVTAEADPTALIIVCAVLGVAILALAVGTFLLWWYKIRPYEYREIEDVASVSSQQGLRSPADGEKKDSSPVMSGVDRFDVQKKDSLVLKDNTLQETTDDDHQTELAKSLNDVLDGSTGPKPIENVATETRKTKGIRFNEMVERIDIEVEAETDDQRL